MPPLSTTDRPDLSRRDEQAIRDAAADWFARLSSETATDADRRACAAWRAADPHHEAAFNRVSATWSALGSLSAADYPADLMRSTLRERARASVQKLIRWICRPRTIIPVSAGAMAASLLIVFYLGKAPHEPATAPVTAQHETGSGETRTFLMTDGSEATLGAKTRINIHFGPSRRDIQLISGDAFFDVIPDPDRPFTVTAGALKATALGTRFDARHNGGVARVAVAEGLVAITYPAVVMDSPGGMGLMDPPGGATAQARLEAGQQVSASADDGLSDVQTIDPANIGLWQQHRLFYADAPLRELIADANRYSAVPIEIGDPALAGYRITASFRGTDIEGMLANLPYAAPVEIDRSDPAVLRLVARD